MTKLAKVDSRYGAPMGRASDAALAGRVRLGRVRLSRGGYDAGGAYWGLGEPLWRAEGAECGERFLRAPDRDVAKAVLRRADPGARFFR